MRGSREDMLRERQVKGNELNDLKGASEVGEQVLEGKNETGRLTFVVDRGKEEATDPRECVRVDKEECRVRSSRRTSGQFLRVVAWKVDRMVIELDSAEEEYDRSSMCSTGSQNS